MRGFSRPETRKVDNQRAAALDRLARFVQRSLGRRGQMPKRELISVFAGETAALHHDERELVGEAVVQRARDAPPFVQLGRLDEVPLIALDLAKRPEQDD